jgi:hypothetical protein
MSCRSATMVLGLVVALVSGAQAAAAQGALPPAGPGGAVAVADRVRAISSAFQAVADRAGEDAWQSADNAYNAALDALDAHRPILEAAQGDPARAAFAGIDPLLADLDVALTIEDAIQTRAVVGYILAQLDRLAPDLSLPAPPVAATDTVLRWRSDLERMLALGEAGQWRDMRNTAISVIDDVQRRGPAVIAAAGPPAAAEVARVRVMAMRLRAAAQAESESDAEMAARLYRAAVEHLLVGLGVLPTPAPASSPATQFHFRGYEVISQPSQLVTVPIVAEDIPQIGLGSYRLRAQWSPSALRLVEVGWELGQGSFARDDAAGTVELALPQAPTGPAGDEVVARLLFEVLGGPVEAGDYLPRPEVQALRAAISETREDVRRGDLPTAAAALTRAYASYVGGQGQAGSLYDRLDRVGQATPLADRLLQLVDLTSQPAPTDVIAVALADLDQEMVRAETVYLDAIRRGEQVVPVTLEVLEATDTTGAALAAREAIPGRIRLEGAAGTANVEATAPATPPARLSPPAPTRAAHSSVTAGAPSAPPTGAATATAGHGTGGFPVALVVSLAVACAVGGVAILWADRRGEGR